MTAIASRNSILGVVAEATQNTLLAPQSSGDYVPLQDDFAIAPNFGQIENAEIRASIGRAASIQGAEEPTASLSFYLKASGTEGAAPHWSDIAKSFFGAQVSEATQRTTVAAAVANVDTFTVEALASTTAGDHGIFYDTAGNSWAWSANVSGADPVPTNTLYTAVAAARKAHVDISGATTATNVADLLRTALNSLTGFSALFTTSGTATLIITSDAAGYVLPGAVYAAAGGVPTGLTYTHTTAGRTASVATLLQSVDAYTNMQAGYGLLVKDAINGYRVRVVHSVSATSPDAITPSFDLPNAPAGGTGLGKPVFWKPANSGHQSLSMWWYGGNGGVVQAVSGALVSEFGYTATANEAINGTASFEALAYYVNPIEVTSATRYLDFTDDTGPFSCAVTVKTYKDPYELAEALTSAMNAANPLITHTVTYLDATGKFKLICTGTVLTLRFATGANTANTIATKIGFTVADESGTVATTGYQSDSAMSLGAPHTPAFDSTQPYVAKNQEVMMGDQTDYACFNASETSFNGTDARRVIEDICAESGRSAALIGGREFEITIKALLNQFDVKQMARFRKGSTVRFQQTMGPKEGGNWVPGSVTYCYSPTCKITEISIVDDEGLATLEMTLQPFVPDDGSGEAFVGCL